MPRIHRDHNSRILAEPADDGQHPPQLLFDWHRHGAGAGGLAAHINQIRTVGDHRQPVRDGPIRGRVSAAVGK